MRVIQIKNRKNELFEVLIDDEDFDNVNQFKWYVSNFGYAVRSIRKMDGKRALQWMHRAIVNCPDGMHVDHIDGNKLNNCKSNLRICTQAENSRNRGKQKNNSSGFKGVCWHKPLNKWQAQINIGGKLKYLGLFACPVEASKAYDEAALRHHGQFAKINSTDWSKADRQCDAVE